MIAISLTLYGGGCVFIVLIAELLGSLMVSVGLKFSLCIWMVIVAVCLIPLTWMGTPKDFWPIAVGALSTTCIACLLVVVTCILDGILIEEKVYPDPTPEGTFKGISILSSHTINFFSAFGSIMFAYAGASTFPTIQADMADRSKFTYSAMIAMGGM